MTQDVAPLVTVAMPAYNHGAYIEESIRGLIAQTHARIELIIIDDGSSDDTAARVEGMAAACRDRFVRFEFRARENRGLCNTLNEAIAWAEGDYFAINDSDDVLLPPAIATLLDNIAGDPNVNGVFGGAVLVDERGRQTGVKEPAERSYSFANILGRDKDMISSSGLLRTQAMRDGGGYLSGLYIEDWYMMLKLTESGGTLRTIATPLARYRNHPTNISKNVEKMLHARLQILDLFASHPGHASRKAQVMTEAAIEYWRVSRATSMKYLFVAIRLDPAIVKRCTFRATLGRLLVPTAIIDRIKSRRDRKRKQSVDF